MAEPSSDAGATTWLDRWWDERVGLVRYPSHVGSPTNPYQAPGVHLIRESATHAVALLARGAPGDAGRAERALGNVLAHQIDAPASVAHGTWRRAPGEPAPGPSPREWIDYDPNWREFVGTALVLALEHESALSSECVAGLETALRRACEGTLARAVPPDYTNIALMSAFLLDRVGDRLGEPGWRRSALDLGRRVAAGYEALGAFPEHNSPTYYGVDLYGLALWRARASSAELRALGERMEAALWRDLVRFYHAGLRNLCGPYTRAYGMDMTRYVAGLGCWIAPLVPASVAPLPPLGDAVPHAHDLFARPLVAILGSRAPDDVRPGLERFAGARSVEQAISELPLRRATARLREHAMWGGEHAGGRIIHWQHHPATIHWATPEGEVGWLRLVSNAPVDALADDDGLAVTVHTGLSWLREAEVSIALHAWPAAGASLEVASGRLALRGRALQLRGAPPFETLPTTAGARDPLRLVHRIAPGRAPERVQLRIDVEAPQP